MVCFGCGKYGHHKEICPTSPPSSNNSREVKSEMPMQNQPLAMEVSDDGKSTCEEGSKYNPWMLVKRNLRRRTSIQKGNFAKIKGITPLNMNPYGKMNALRKDSVGGSQFLALDSANPQEGKA